MQQILLRPETLLEAIMTDMAHSGIAGLKPVHQTEPPQFLFAGNLMTLHLTASRRAGRSV